MSPYYLSFGSTHLVKADEWVDYTVIDTSNDTNMFFGAWPPGHYLGNWSVAVGENIKYTITSSDNVSINGTLTLGNYTFTDVRNVDVASALIISIYPWNGGFFANSSDWENIKTQLEDTNTIIEEESNYSHLINTLNRYFQIIKFNTSDYFGQTSLFFYDKESGILLYAKSCFGNYSLHISLSLTSLEIGLPSKTSSLDYLSVLSISLILFIMVILKKKRLKKNP